MTDGPQQVQWEHVSVSTWAQLGKLYDERLSVWRRWIFRGQGNARWRLESSLERAVRRFAVLPEDIPKVEDGLLRRFKREAHHYCPHVPEDQDIMAWLALMQHGRSSAWVPS